MSPEPLDSAFDILVKQLSQQLGPCSGINSEDVDPKELERLMAEYVSDETHWKKYFFPSSHHAYTRNLVDKGNGKSNLVSLAAIRGSAFAVSHLHQATHVMFIVIPYDGCDLNNQGYDFANNGSSFLFGRRTKPARYMSAFACERKAFALT